MGYCGYGYVRTKCTNAIDIEFVCGLEYAFPINGAEIHVLMAVLVANIFGKVVHGDDVTAKLSRFSNGRGLKRAGTKDHEAFAC